MRCCLLDYLCLLCALTQCAGSKDNISATVVKLPGAVLGPPANGGVERRRQQRLLSQKTQQEAVTATD